MATTIAPGVVANDGATLGTVNANRVFGNATGNNAAQAAPSGLKPTAHFANTVANPVDGTANGIPFATQNPGRDTFRMYDPTGWVQGGNVTGKLGAYAGPVSHQYVPFGQGKTLDPSEGFNQVMMELSQHFEPMIQAKVMKQPRWWHDRIARGAFTLFNGAVHETRIFRGGLMKYSGLDEWQDIDPYPSATNNPCGALPYNTYKYGWEALAWRGKKSAWGSDPICVDQFKFMDQAQQQLAWILQTGAEYGIQMQEVWNRDNFIYTSVMFDRGFVMSSEYNGPSSPKYYYDPFKYKAATSDLVKVGGEVKPFVIFDASVKLENLNFDVLDQVRESLKIRCPDAAVSSAGGSPTFAIAMSADDLERYIRGNEEERRLWVEANPQALITGYGFAPTTFRKWIITNDGNQLRFKLVGYIAKYDATEAAKFNNIGYKDGGLKDKPVYVAVVVDPMQASARAGVNGTVIPEDNPEYYAAEIAIAPIFMNQVFTNQFVPSVSSLGSGTSFGPVTGLNGQWGWLNIQTPDNPFRNRGNFYGQYEIVPKPETHVVHCTSFLYKRCTAALPSLCPAENPHVNRTAYASTTTAADAVVTNNIAELVLDGGLLAGTGDKVTIKGKVDTDTTDTTAATEEATYDAYVIAARTPHQIKVQIVGATIAEGSIPAGSTVTNPAAPVITDGRD